MTYPGAKTGIKDSFNTTPVECATGCEICEGQATFCSKCKVDGGLKYYFDTKTNSCVEESLIPDFKYGDDSDMTIKDFDS